MIASPAFFRTDAQSVVVDFVVDMKLTDGLSTRFEGREVEAPRENGGEGDAATGVGDERGEKVEGVSLGWVLRREGARAGD